MSQADSIQKSFENFSLALNTFKEFLAEASTTDKEKAGVIQAFEFSYEALWKCLQKIAGAEGLDVASPRKAFAFAFKAGIVMDEGLWLKVIESRNLTSHTYNKLLAQLIYADINKFYAPAFQEIHAHIKTHISQM